MDVQIVEITAEQFVAAVPERHPNAEAVVEELRFYTVLDGWYLGVLFRDRPDNQFNYAILGPDGKGTNRFIAGEFSFDSESEAHDKLLAELRRTAAGGRRLHPEA